MINKKLAGISQYQYNKTYLEIINQAPTIKWTIDRFFPKFKEACLLDNVVFDVYLKYRKNFNKEFGIWEVKLLEINPFFKMTDPCLFDWRKMENFKGQFLYRDIKENKNEF